ncbi:family 10 glycosylhydrolase [Flavobacterium sp. CHNK8]|uniref:glycoside hydrolase family 10 protein n=1 Tax=Flavobacterium sp. CHNK8 TaxID=2871165 RepID=UPI001C8E1783|nr:family 10 glycosylhydrolase [Flavobacterium sp. CHNK8]QZK90437.1 family 10 glycosylhydrolase [Flavobacterium sp. CHNK8]
MKTHKNHIFLTILLLLFFTNGIAQSPTLHPKNEFRAVWIATVVNIDWPKKGTDSVSKQKTDYLELLDTYKKLNYNAVIVQIRSVGDAFYPTQLAPWSRFLTGKEGKAPDPYYDALQWMITEAHTRGFEFHAWLNPYRATMDYNTQILSSEHDYFKHPEWMIKYGGKIYYNPALPEVQAHLLNVVNEIVTNYDIDAIHFDDYFYPYRIPGEEFNDSASFKLYGNVMKLEDWRRSNVNTFVKDVAVTIKKNKPWVQFGISPFGVWRNKSVDPKGSDTEAGQTNYDDLFADPLAWMDQKWIDYIIPQLYWSIDHPKASYAKLLRWWSENSNNTAIYIGNSSYKVNADSDKKWNNPNEIPNQIDLTRTYKNVQGNAFFSAKSFVNKNQNVTTLLAQNQYKYPALPTVVPAAIKKNEVVPAVQAAFSNEIASGFQIVYPTGSKMRYAVLYGSSANAKIDFNDASHIIDKVALIENLETLQIFVPTYKLHKNKTCAVTFIDYYGNESAPTFINVAEH